MLPEVLSFENQLRLGLRVLKRLHKRAKARVVERQETLQRCMEWQKLYHQGLLLQANLYRIEQGAASVTVSDWEQEGKEHAIKLDPFVSPHNQIKAMFRQSKKYERGIPHAKIQLDLAGSDLALRTRQLEELEKVTSQDEFNAFCQKHQFDPTEPEGRKIERKVIEPAKPYRVFTSQAGRQIWVGKSARENDQLSFHYANGLDWWLHARDCPGSHVVIRGLNGDEPDEETLLDAAELALRYCKLKNRTDGEVTLTQAKFLKSVKNAPGKVMLSQHRTVRIRMDDARWNRLRKG